MVNQLQEEYPSLRYEPCRLHALDLILKHEFSAHFSEQTTSSNLPYDFVQNMVRNWKQKLCNYLESCEQQEATYHIGLPPTDSKRLDYEFLLKCVKSLRFAGREPINLYITNIPQQPPSVSNARWKSRAIYSVFSEVFGNKDDQIVSINTFIIQVCLLYKFSYN